VWARADPAPFAVERLANAILQATAEHDMKASAILLGRRIRVENEIE